MSYLCSVCPVALTDSFCTAKKCLVSACWPLVIETEVTEFSEHTKHMKVTPQKLYWTNHSFSCADSWTVPTGSPAHGVPHLSQVSTLRLTRLVTHASLRASLGSHLPHYSFYWPLGNLNKCFEESVTNKSRCRLIHFFFFNPKYYI